MLELLWNNSAVCPQKTFLNGPAGWISKYYQNDRWPEQATFMLDCPALEQIFTIWLIKDKITEFRRKVFAFIPFPAAFNSLDQEAFWQILESNSLREIQWRLFKALHHGKESCVKVNGRHILFFQITIGVRQECAVAPELFSVIIDHVLTKKTSSFSFRLEFRDRIISDANFSEDLAILADIMDQLLKVLRITGEDAAKVGLHTNWKKKNLSP